MTDIIEIYDNYAELGIRTRKITKGKEIDLVREYIDYRKSNFVPTNDKKLAVFLEAKIGNSYPDIVFVEFNPNTYCDWNSIRDELKTTDYKILYHIHSQQGIRSRDLVEQLGFTWKETFLSIERLYDSKMISRKNKLWLAQEDKIGTYKIEAVEAKINNWQELLQQSILNKNFASESYALSLIDTIPKIEVVKRFNRLGIGMYIKKDGEFTIIKKAKKVNIPVSFNSILFNEWIGKILTKERLQLC